MAHTVIKVYQGTSVRKTEYKESDTRFNEVLSQAFDVYKPHCKVVGVSTNEEGLYGIYAIGVPDNAPFDVNGERMDLSKVRLDPKANNLISFKVCAEFSKVKVYYEGNINNVVLDSGRPIFGTGVYIGEDAFTVYYPTEGDAITGTIIERMTERGFSAVTFYADGTKSDESVYKYVEVA